MAYTDSKMPRAVTGWGGRALAAAFALAMATAWQAGPAAAQIEVRISSGTQEQTSAPASAPAGALNPVEARNQAGMYQAEEEAQKIVPAPGTVMQSTENSSLGKTGTVAPAPSLNLNNDQLVLKEGETTESVAVKSGAELLKMLGLQQREAPKQSDDLEINEDTTNSLFDMSAVERLKGDKPTVVYRVVIEDKPLPDPMIVPWIRQAKMLQERFDKAVAMLASNQVDQGRQELLAIASDFPDSDYAVQARALLKKLDDLSKEEMPQPVIKEETTVTVELSPNIQVGTIIVDPNDPAGSRAMISGRMYKVGDVINSAPGHRLVGISQTAVKIEVEQSGLKQTFDVPVRPTGTIQK